MGEAGIGNVIIVLIKLILNLLVLPLYLVLIWIPPLNLLLFYLLNGYLLGRQHFEMVAVPRLDLATAKPLRRSFRGPVILAGAALPSLLTITHLNHVTHIIPPPLMPPSSENLPTPPPYL